MAKWCNSAVLDEALSYIKNNVVLMTICSQQPTTYAEATVTYKLADVAMSSSDFTIGPGDTSGRKVTVAAKNNIDVDNSGTPTHVALCSENTLLYVTTCTGPDLTQGSTVNVSSWGIEIADPS